MIDAHQNKKYSVQEYDPNWHQKFLSIKKILEKVFGDKALAIEHVGSTSIKDMKAKPVIDVLVVVDKMKSFIKERRLMLKLGYDWKENYIAPNSQIFAKTLGDGSRKENIHICEKDSFKARQFLDTTDFLRAHPEWAKKYADLKSELYKKFPKDYISYRDGKKNFLEEMGRRAIEWRMKSKNPPI